MLPEKSLPSRLALVAVLLCAADSSHAQADRFLNNVNVAITPASPASDRVMGRVTLYDSILRLQDGVEVQTVWIEARGDSTLAVVSSKLGTREGVFMYGNPGKAGGQFTVSGQAHVETGYLNLRLADWRVDDSRVAAEALQFNGAQVTIRSGSEVLVSSPRFGALEIFDERPADRPSTLLIEGSGTRLATQTMSIYRSAQGAQLAVRQGGLLTVGGAIEWNRDEGGPVAIDVEAARIKGAAGIWAGSNASLALSQGGELQLGQALTLAGASLLVGGRAAPTAPGYLMVPAIELRAGAKGQMPELILNHTADAYVFDTPLHGAGTVLHRAGHTLWQQAAMSADMVVQGGTLSLRQSNTMGGLALARNAALILLPGSQSRAHGPLDLSGALTVTLGAQTDPARAPLSATQAARLDGAQLWVDAATGVREGQAYAVLAADQGVHGQFAQVGLRQPLAYLQPHARYSADQVTVTLEKAAPLHSLTPAGVARTVAQIIDNLPPDDLLYQHVLRLPAGTPGRVLPVLSGDALAAVHGSLRKVAQPSAAAHRRLHADPHPALPVWVQPAGAWQHEAGAPTLDVRSHGLFVGGDAAAGVWRAGAALGYVHSRMSMPSRATRARGDAYAAMVYAGRHWQHESGVITFSASAGHVWHALRSQRDMRAAGLDHTLNARWQGGATQAELQLAYARPLTQTWSVGPYLAAGIEHLHVPAYREHGGLAALHYRASAAWQGRATLGLRAGWQWGQGRWRAGLGWQRRAGDLRPRATVSLAQDAQRYVVQGLPQARDAAVLELGLDFVVGADATLALSYQAWLAPGSRQQEAALAWRWRY